MKVTARNWQPDSSSLRYLSSQQEEDDVEISVSTEMEDSFLKTCSSQNVGSSGGAFKMKASAPDDSVGQLASLLARSETKLDVLQVSSKAMRALTNLKMASMSCDEGDKEKITRMIQRMEKLIKRIQKKIRLLDKEEQLERQRELAEKEKNEAKAKELGDELRSRRRKRRKDEKDYADKEMREDMKEATSELMSSLGSIGTASPVSNDAVSAADMSGAAMAAAPVESVSFDVTV